MTYSPKIQTLFIPAVATLALWGTLIAVFSLLGIYDRLLWKEPSFSLPVYSMFWLGLVLIGAMGAWLSRYAGGNVAERIIAALAMVLGKVIGYAILLPVAVVISGYSSLHFVYGGFSFILVKYIAAPGCALLLGALPFLGNRNTPSCSTSI